MRRIILATLAVAATVTGATAADAQYYRAPGYGGGAGICQREASRAWNRREADRIYRHCVKDLRRAERDRWRHERRYRGW
jgi:ribosomal protein L13